MGYVQTGLSGLSQVRFENGEAAARATGFVPPAPIIGQTVPLSPMLSPDPLKQIIIGGNGTRYGTVPLSPMLSPDPLKQIIIGGNGTRYGTVPLSPMLSPDPLKQIIIGGNGTRYGTVPLSPMLSPDPLKQIIIGGNGTRYGTVPLSPMLSPDPLKQIIIGGNGTRYGTVPLSPMLSPDPLKQIIIGGNGTQYGRGFVPVVRETILSTVIPGAPTFEVDDSRIERRLLPSILPAETRVPIVSEPTEAARTKLAFELAEARKWGYTHTAWMALGATARGQIRAKYPDGYKPVMRDGVSVEAAGVDLVAGRDPQRVKIHASGAGDYEGGIEIADPPSTVPLVSTKSGIAFDDILRIDPLKIQTPAEAAGVVAPSTQNMMRYGLMAVAGWILWDMFVKPKKPQRQTRRRTAGRSAARRRRRFYPHESRKRHLRQGWQ